MLEIHAENVKLIFVKIPLIVALDFLVRICNCCGKCNDKERRGE
jgi:hypothetical protein